MRYLAAIGPSQHRFSIQHFVRNALVQTTFASVLAIFAAGFLTPGPAQAKTQICNGGQAEILVAYMWPDGTFGAGDLDYIKVEGWHRLGPGQCDKNEGRLRAAIAQLDGQGSWGFPDYTLDGSLAWRVFNRTRHRSCVAPPGKRFKYGPGPSREPCPTGFVETTFPLEADDNGGLFPATVNIKTTVFPKLLPLEDAPVASTSPPRIKLLEQPPEKAPEPDAAEGSGMRAMKNAGLFAGGARAKLPDPEATKLNNFILEVIISRTIPLLCPNDYSLVGATSAEDRAKALGIANYQGSVAAGVSAVLLLLDPKNADNPILKAATTPEVTKTAGWVTGVGKLLVEQHSCSNPVFLALSEPSHLYQAKAGKR